MSSDRCAFLTTRLVVLCRGYKSPELRRSFGQEGSRAKRFCLHEKHTRGDARNEVTCEIGAEIPAAHTLFAWEMDVCQKQVHSYLFIHTIYVLCNGMPSDFFFETSFWRSDSFSFVPQSLICSRKPWGACAC